MHTCQLENEMITARVTSGREAIALNRALTKKRAIFSRLVHPNVIFWAVQSGT
jgi:hypothetical protein